MNISLSPEIEQFVKEQLASGQYQSADEVINEGLRLLMLQERIYKGRFAELKKEIMIGIEQLDRGEGIDGETAMKQLRDELIQRSHQHSQP